MLADRLAGLRGYAPQPKGLPGRRGNRPLLQADPEPLSLRAALREHSATPPAHQPLALTPEPSIGGWRNAGGTAVDALRWGRHGARPWCCSWSPGWRRGQQLARLEEGALVALTGGRVAGPTAAGAGRRSAARSRTSRRGWSRELSLSPRLTRYGLLDDPTGNSALPLSTFPARTEERARRWANCSCCWRGQQRGEERTTRGGSAQRPRRQCSTSGR
jgi:hypothetical protein